MNEKDCICSARGGNACLSNGMRVRGGIFQFQPGVKRGSQLCAKLLGSGQGV